MNNTKLKGAFLHTFVSFPMSDLEHSWILCVYTSPTATSCQASTLWGKPSQKKKKKIRHAKESVFKQLFQIMGVRRFSLMFIG